MNAFVHPYFAFYVVFINLKTLCLLITSIAIYISEVLCTHTGDLDCTQYLYSVLYFCTIFFIIILITYSIFVMIYLFIVITHLLIILLFYVYPVIGKHYIYIYLPV